jgi:hypothetical protein
MMAEFHETTKSRDRSSLCASANNPTHAGVMEERETPTSRVATIAFPSVKSVSLQDEVFVFVEDFHAAILVSSLILAWRAANRAVMAVQPVEVRT